MCASRRRSSASAAASCMGRFCEQALSERIPARVVEEARDATARKFVRGGRCGSPTRAEAYFWGVVRRRALRGEAPGLCDRLLVASLASELRDAGHGAAEVFHELQRVYGRAVDATVIEPYRPAPAPQQAA